MHDCNGQKLEIGDTVMIPAVITQISTATEDFCNVWVETTMGRRPDGKKVSISAINTGVMLKVAGVDVKSDQ